MRVALDTHALVRWCVRPDLLTRAQQHALKTIHNANPAIVADISLWEIAVLSSDGRLALDIPLVEWLTRAVSPPLVRVVGITPNIAEEVARLTDWANRDPADRLIVATARIYGADLITDDRRIRESGLVAVI